MILHRFFPVTLALTILAVPAAAQDRPPDPSLTSFPLSLLLYKHAPDAFGDEFMRRQTELQMQKDQYYYGLVQNLGRAKVSKHVFVFSESQIKGRVVSFARDELLPTYKKYWTQAASAMPTRVTFSLDQPLEGLEYASGTLKTKSRSELLAFWPDQRIGKEGVGRISREALLKSEPLGAREFVNPVPTLWAAMPSSAFAETVYVRIEKPIVLAFDRSIVIPALPLDARTAEHMWRKPVWDCHDYKFRRKGMDAKQAKAAAEQCRAEFEHYTPGLRTVVEIEIERIDHRERSWLIWAKVLGAKVLGPRREVLKSIAGSQFPVPEDVWSTHKKNEREKEAAAAATASTEQAAVERQRELLRKADVIGVRPGMSIEEAEKIIRAHFRVAYVSADSSHGKTSPDLFDAYKAFHNADNSEAIVLFKGSASNNTVLAVARTFALGADMKGDQNLNKVKELLKAKYGRTRSRFQV